MFSPIETLIKSFNSDEFLTSEQHGQLHEAGIFVVGSRSPFTWDYDCPDCEEYLRQFLNEKLGFQVPKYELTNLLAEGIRSKNLNLIKELPAKYEQYKYIVLYYDYPFGFQYLRHDLQYISHFGIVYKKGGHGEPIVLSKISSSAVTLHSAFNKSIVDYYTKSEIHKTSGGVYFLAIDELRQFVSNQESNSEL